MLRILLAASLLVGIVNHTRSDAQERRAESARLADYVAMRQSEFGQIPSDRQKELSEFADYVGQLSKSGQPVRLNFICTHNSRRSHLAQIWASVAAHHHGVDGIETYSGGTEGTAMNARVVAALTRAGIEVSSTSDVDATNPKYLVRFATDLEPLTCFSKAYDESPNPSADFCAVMVCSDADTNCPIVRGADKRFAITYIDPKVADGTPQEAETYDERCSQIAREMLYVFSLIK